MNMIDKLIFILASIICLLFNESLVEVITDNMELAQLKWLFGEKKWVMTIRRYFILWTRIVLYGGALVMIAIIVFKIGF
jgi:hypothetical protein